jgi:hypothetical protein
VAFQYPDGVVRAGRPPRFSLSARGQKKNHCSAPRTFASPAIAANVYRLITKCYMVFA